MSLLSKLVTRSVAAIPSALWEIPAVSRPTIDGQRTNGRTHVAMTLLKRDLLATSPPSAAKRLRLERAMQLLDSGCKRPVTVTDVAVDGPAGPLPARLYEPQGVSNPSGLVVTVHGGGFHLLSVAAYDQLSRSFAEEAGVRVFSVEYRLAPEHPFPAAFDDVLTGYRYAVDHAAELGADPGRIAIMGDSAGGALASAVGLHLGADPVYRPALVALEYPFLDPQVDRYESTRLFEVPLDRGCIVRAAEWYTPTADGLADPRAWVMAADDLTAMPPTYIATGGMDVLRDQGEAFAERLRAAAVDVEVRRFANLPHGFRGLVMDREARSAATEIAQHVRSRLS